jgi:hypothetical protein
MKKAKLLWTIVVGVVVVLVIVVLGAWAMIDRLAKQGIQQGGTYALGVPTTVESVSLSLLGGTLQMDKLNFANPAGYKTAHLMQTGQFQLEVQPGSVLTDTVVVPKIELSGLDMNIESKGLKTNVSMVLDHVKSLGGGSGEQKPSAQAKESEGGGKKVRVDRVVIRDVVAHIELPASGAQPLTVKVPEIALNNVSSDKPVDIATLIGRLMPAIVAGVLEQGKGIIPGDMLASLQTDVSGTVAALGGQATQLAQQASTMVGAQVQNLAQGAQQAVTGVTQGAAGALQKAQESAGGALKGAIGGVAGAASQPAGQTEGKGVGKALEGLFKKEK